jgi:uncharacterized HAD superfamily protein
MTIGIDIDDTITNSSELIIEYAKKYFASDDINLINDLLHGNNITSKMTAFYDKYLLKLLSSYSIKESVKDVIDRLRLKGHKIILISARGYKVKVGQIKVTKDYLKKHNIKTDKMIFKARDKVKACLENNVDLMIDDSVKVLENLKSSGINTLLFTSISNKDIKTNITRVESWLELELYINKVNE